VRTLVDGLRGGYDIEVAAHGPNGSLVDACRASAVPFHHLENLVRDPDPRRDVTALVELRALVRRVHPDIVQINSTKAGMLGRLALIGTGIPVVFTAHGWAFSGRRGRGGLAAVMVERMTAPLSTAIVCVSDWDLRLAIDRRLAPPARLHAIHNGIVVGAPPPDRGPWPADPVLVCVARLAPPKDLGLLLAALAEDGLAAWRLRVIGDGPERGRLETRARTLGVADRVEWLGHRTDVSEQLAIADAFVLPSRWEGLPYSILEAMVAGLPVVASRVGGIPELIVDGVTGFLTERDSVPALADALKRLGADGSHSREMGRAGYERARRVFSVDGMLRSYDGLFRSLLARKTMARAGAREATL
jgi:glycosyltransferase involved in cell wall biosynthesis